ncbi:MAG: DUF2283 domain-containing protein [Thaumarchaeota archaeon]|nr:DUF2283 domain-containing protein [Nitrososphaerota archaeon]
MSKAVDVKFDMDANAAYVRLGTGRVTKTKEGKVDSLDVLFDYRKDGQLIGVEVLNLKKALELYFKPKIPQIQAIAEAKSK